MSLASTLGVRVMVWTGATVPAPPPSVVSASLMSAQVVNDAKAGDGFELTFALGKDSVTDYSILSGGSLDPYNRVVIAVVMGVIPSVLIDGIITEHNISQSDRPGESTLTVRGKDVSVMMDLEEKNATFPNQPDFVIFTSLIGNYAQYGLVPMPFPTTDVPIELMRVPRQAETDLAFIKKLAARNGFIFYVEPVTLGVNTAYFGPNTRIGVPQSGLIIDQGAFSNLKSLNFSRDGAAAVSATGSFVEPLSMSVVDIPSLPSLNIPPLSSSPEQPKRKVLLRDSSKLDPAAAMTSSAAAVTNAPDSVTATGEIDCVRYGAVLRARKLVGIAGAGQTHDGFYYVQKVTHMIQPHITYTQNFEATREGTGALLPTIGPAL
jgi:hypothetical protein